MLDNAGVTRGHPTIYWKPSKRTGSPTNTSLMLSEAFTNDQVEVLKSLLEIFPSAYPSYDILASQTTKPTSQSLRVFHSYHSSMVNLEMGDKGLGALLMVYCPGGDPQFSEWLLENGADPNPNRGSFLMCRRDPLTKAIYCDQPPSLMRKLHQCGAEVHPKHANLAVSWQECEETVELILKYCRWDYGRRPIANKRKVVKTARQTGNASLILLVESHTKVKRSWMKMVMEWLFY